MKKNNRIIALIIAMVMVIAMAIPAMAAENDYKITVTNTNDSISIDGQIYSAYKLFDLSYNTSKTAYAYTISTNNYFYKTTAAKAVLDNYFTFTASASDSTVMVVEPKTTGTYYDSTTKTITEVGARKLADDLQQYLASATPVKTGTADGETAEITVGEDGYFIVTGGATPTDPNADETVVSAVILTNAQPTAAVAPKVSVPTLDKKATGVVELDEGSETEVDGAVLADGKAAVAKVGAKVSYELDSITPDLRGYEDYIFIITDEISDGLTYDNASLSSLVVKIGGTIVPATSSVEGNTVTNYTLAVNGQKFTLTIPFATLKRYNAGTAIVVTYNAFVNNKALTTDYENNKANLEYSHSPYDDTTNKTPDKEVYVIDLNIDVNKVAENANGSKLAGATFKLYKTVSGEVTYSEAAEFDANATYYSDNDGADTVVAIADAEEFSAYTGTLYIKEAGEDSKRYYKWDAANNVVTWVTTGGDDFVTNNQGKLTTQVRGLDQGTYYLEETVAPKGYNLLTNPVEVTITATETSSANEHKVTYTSSSGASITNGIVDLTQEQKSAQPVATATIINNAGTVLPATGGIGTTIFYIVGIVLVLGSGVVMITRRRMDVQ